MEVCCSGFDRAELAGAVEKNLSRGLVLVEDVLFWGGRRAGGERWGGGLEGFGGWGLGVGFVGLAVMEEGVLDGMMGGG